MSRSRRDARRERWKQRVPRWYVPELQLVSLLVGAALATGWMVRQTLMVGPVRPVALLAVPITLMLAWAIEYWLHRGPLHKRTVWADRLFVQHTLHHHRYFDHAQMTIDSRRDLYFVIFRIDLPLAILAVAFALFAGVRAMLGVDVGMMVGVTIIAHYLALEAIHLMTHLPAPWFRRWPLRAPVFRRLREHHRLHHDPRRMRSENFSITAPFVDSLLGTRVRAKPGDFDAPVDARPELEPH